ncbi:MAG: hypothetical protein ACLFWB_01145 [Armatimonadota bacterium]
MARRAATISMYPRCLLKPLQSLVPAVTVGVYLEDVTPRVPRFIEALSSSL